jgi:hypothetical protein
MPGFLGADIEQLHAQATLTTGSGERLGELAELLVTAGSSLSWEGTDADAFRDRLLDAAGGGLRECAGMLDAAARALAQHAVQQELTSDADGRIDAARYADLLGGEGFWSDVIDGAQDVWGSPLNPFSKPLTIDDLGGRYLDTPEGEGFDPADVDLSAAAIRDQTVRQGSLGDCWFLAGLMAVADTDPDFLAERIALRDDGIWEVVLYEDGEEVRVSVSPEQIAADGARVDDDGSRNSWSDDPLGYMSIYEQAAINHLGPDYKSVIADTPGAGLELITGQPSSDDTPFTGSPTADDFAAALDENRPITAMSDPIRPWRDDISAAHVYHVRSIDPDTGLLTLVNPWGNTGTGPDDMPHTVEISVAEYNANFVMTGVGARPDEFGSRP